MITLEEALNALGEAMQEELEDKYHLQKAQLALSLREARCAQDTRHQERTDGTKLTERMIEEEVTLDPEVVELKKDVFERQRTHDTDKYNLEYYRLLVKYLTYSSATATE